MPKPWARYEVNFINHDKFRAITANAIGLWLEGKNYADDKHTDGLLPAYEIKHWRFFGAKSVALLLTSCGLKPGTDTPYKPLWFAVEGFGYRMHDYLEHNECREEALSRIADAEANKVRAKELDREYKRRGRAARTMKADEALSGSCPVVCPAEVNRTPTGNPVMSGSYQKVEARNQNEEKSRSGAPPTARSGHPIFKGHKLTVFEWQFDECAKILGTFTESFDLHAWFFALDAAALKANLVIPKRDNNAWLEARLWEEIHTRHLPITLAGQSSVTDDAAAVLEIVKRREGGQW